MSFTGKKYYTKLRKFVNGKPTQQVKENLITDPDYIKPYDDINGCPKGTSTPAPVAAPTTY